MTPTTDLVKGLISLSESPQGAHEILAPDVFVDVNVPEWRFQLQGIEPFLQWMKTEIPDGQTVLAAHRIDTADGFAVETESTAQKDGARAYSRSVWLATVDGGRISALTLYCTGEWNEQTVARHAAEAPMIRA